MDDLARPHDLVRLTDPLAVLTGSEPAWVSRSVTATPWAVVRRTPAPPGHIAVGIRGRARHQRHALEIPADAVARLVRPEDIRLRSDRVARWTPALVALRQCQRALRRFSHPWGPTGSAGFEMATGHPTTTTSSSDLDLIVRIDPLPSPSWAAELVDRLSALPTRVDCQLETRAGAVALTELATGVDTILLRTGAPPRLVSR